MHKTPAVWFTNRLLNTLLSTVYILAKLAGQVRDSFISLTGCKTTKNETKGIFFNLLSLSPFI